MEIWLIEDGKKTGPFIDFEVRSRIHAGEVKAETKVWYRDLDTWTPLGESPLFANEFEKEAEPELVTAENVEAYTAKLDQELREQLAAPNENSDQSGEPAGPLAGVPALPRNLHLWRRFAARWFDFILYSLLMTAVIVWSGRSIFELASNSLFAFVSILPWFFLESLSTCIWGSTPGKWLVGLKVRGVHGQKLTAGQAILRTMRVIILGMGFGQGVLIIICHSIAAWLGFKRQIVLWDTPVGTNVLLDDPKPAKWLALGGFLFLFFFLYTLLMLPMMSQMDTDKLSPEEKKVWEQVFPPAAEDPDSLPEDFVEEN